MSKRPKAIVLDSWAIIAYLENEPGAENVADIIADAHEQQIPLLMSVVNAAKSGISLPGRHPLVRLMPAPSNFRTSA